MENMKCFYIQLKCWKGEKEYLLSGAVIASDKGEAERIGRQTASTYRGIENFTIALYSLIELTEAAPAQFSMEQLY